MILDNDLKKSYDIVGKKIFKLNSLSKKSIQSSVNLFNKESLKLRVPKPINVDVFTLVSGLPFSKILINSLLRLKKDIRKVLKKTLCYWVKPENLAVEYCVFKWPNDNWNSSWLDKIKNFIKKREYDAFELKIYGIQIHDDGCIIAKGYDDGFIRGIRSEIISNLNFIPVRQSNWAHIPIARILEPISRKDLIEIRKKVNSLSDIYLGTEKIIEAKLVHETRWYMEKKKILYTKKFKI